MLNKYDIFKCLDISLNNKEKEYLLKHSNDIIALKDGYVWKCIFDNFGLQDDKIECIIERYISYLNGFAVFDGSCFDVVIFTRSSLDMRNF